MSPIEIKKNRRMLNEVLERNVQKIEHKSAELQATFDWDEFSELDWAGFGKSIDSEVKYLPGSFEQLGSGFNLACQDEDYREELVKIDSIVILPAKEAKPASKTTSTLADGRITITLNTLGSTMDAKDWAKALREAYA